MFFIAARSSLLSGFVIAVFNAADRLQVLTALVKYSKAICVQTDAMACVLITPMKSDGTLVIRSDDVATIATYRLRITLRH